MSTVKRHTIEDFKKTIEVESRHPDYFLKEFEGESPYPKEPYRTETFGVAYLRKGQLHLTTGLTDHEIKAPALLTMGPNVIRKWTNTYRNADADVIFFKKDFLAIHYANSSLLNNLPYFEQADSHVFELIKQDEECIQRIFQNLKDFIRSNYKNKDHFVRQQIAILHYMLDELYTAKHQDARNSPNSMLAKFKTLAAKEINWHREVSYYAEALNTTSKTLSDTVKAETGRTASQFLHDLVILEAKILLQNNDISISETAYKLSFPDPSTFGKYFKKYSGRTPSDYRAEILTS